MNSQSNFWGVFHLLKKQLIAVDDFSIGADVWI